MAVRSSQSRSGRSHDEVLQKPRGSIHGRVQLVGPEHFGIVCVDCAKVRSKWLLADFYGKVLVPPTRVNHNRVELDAWTQQVRDMCQLHGLGEVLVAIERTGRYHHVVRDAFQRARFETRMVHPFTGKHFRQPADPDNKIDDGDLAAIHRATVTGFALLEPTLDNTYESLRLLARQRRDLVHKTTMLACQIREHLEAAWPGYGALFSELWESKLAWPLLHHYASPQEPLQAGQPAVSLWLRQERIRFQKESLETVFSWAAQSWAAQAAPGEASAALRRRLALVQYDDRQRKTQEILLLERELAGYLSQTPYLLMLSFPGINVVWAAEFARVAPHYGIKVIWNDPERWHKMQCEGVPIDVVPEGRKPRKDAPTAIPGPEQLGVREGADYAEIAGWTETKLGSYRVQDQADVVQVIKVLTPATLKRIRKHLAKTHARGDRVSAWRSGRRGRRPLARSWHRPSRCRGNELGHRQGAAALSCRPTGQPGVSRPSRTPAAGSRAA